MEKVLGISVTKPDGAIDCVAKGLSRINSIIPPKMRVANKNITADIASIYESGKNKT